MLLIFATFRVYHSAMRPEIIIKYGKLIDPIFAHYAKERYPDWEPPEPEAVKEKVQIFKEEWGRAGESVLEGLSDATRLHFKTNRIPVYIVSGTPRDTSDPIVIRSRYEPWQFVDVLTHELIHRLLSENKVPLPDLEDDDSVKRHVLVHAIHMYVYREVLKDESRMEANLERSRSHTDDSYVRSWDIVLGQGYKEIIEKYVRASARNKPL